jgi:phospholipid/cholesterol/gamma-HCH transport system substrate-binding protein
MAALRKLPRADRRLKAIALVLLALAIGSVAWTLRPGESRVDVVAYVANSNGIYAGDEVRVLGVPVGRIDEITPERDRVRIELHYDGDVKVPADAKAAIVAPSLVSSRYLQLAPRYEGGPVMADGDAIPLERTATPVEWDEVKDQLNDLAVALGPRGANKQGADKQGALDRLLRATSATVDGKGATINETIHHLSEAVRTLQAGGSDTFSTVRNLQVFVSALAQSDVQVGQFLTKLDGVSGLLVDNRQSLRAALRSLGATVGQVEEFVRANGDDLTRTMRRLTRVARVVAGQQDELAQALHVAPNALANLIESYHSGQNAVAVDVHAANIHSPGQLVCGAIGGAAGASGADAADLCGDVVGNLLDRLAGSPGTIRTVEFIKQLLGVW